MISLGGTTANIFVAFTFLVSIQVGNAFVISPPILGKCSWASAEFSPRLMAADTTENKLTAADIVARSRKALGMDTVEDEAPPKIFEDDIYGFITESLLLLEKRVQSGPGSLSVQEVNALTEMSQRISMEMRNPAFASTNLAPAPFQPELSSTASVTQTMPLFAAAPTVATTTALTPTTPEKPDLSEEGGDYDGTGGMGMAKGTRNTYVIPGMEEMNPEEYRAELQRTVIERQAERRRIRYGLVGNRAAHDYLSTLGYGGTSKSLSVGRDEASEKKVESKRIPSGLVDNPADNDYLSSLDYDETSQSLSVRSDEGSE